MSLTAGAERRRAEGENTMDASRDQNRGIQGH